MYFSSVFVPASCETQGCSGQTSGLVCHGHPWVSLYSPALTVITEQHGYTVLYSFAQGNLPKPGILPVTDRLYVHGSP